MKSKILCDISERPHSMTLERVMKAPADMLYRAWSEKFEWFGEAETVMMKPELDRPYFFKSRYDWGAHPHHGRFTELEPNRVIEMTWITGAGGTEGAETLLRIELTPQAGGTLLRMTHSGFRDEKSCQGHKDNWPLALDTLEECLSPAR